MWSEAGQVLPEDFRGKSWLVSWDQAVKGHRPRSGLCGLGLQAEGAGKAF